MRIENWGNGMGCIEHYEVDDEAIHSLFGLFLQTFDLMRLVLPHLIRRLARDMAKADAIASKKYYGASTPVADDE